jgi:hypothetical protein
MHIGIADRRQPFRYSPCAPGQRRGDDADVSVDERRCSEFRCSEV